MRPAGPSPLVLPCVEAAMSPSTASLLHSPGPFTPPLSIKSVLVSAGQVLVLRQPDGRWDLPGGRVEPNETPAAALARECWEETGLLVTAGPELILWPRVKPDGSRRQILTVIGQPRRPFALADLVLSDEHRDAHLLAPAAALTLDLRPDYARAIAAVMRRLVAANGSAAAQ
ncbi:hypothetical protein CCR85_08450 [Rhodothalassium salexigens]|nr:hypothetical protein [Rhodothalassium salexigens]